MLIRVTIHFTYPPPALLCLRTVCSNCFLICTTGTDERKLDVAEMLSPRGHIAAGWCQSYMNRSMNRWIDHPRRGNAAYIVGTNCWCLHYDAVWANLCEGEVEDGMEVVCHLAINIKPWEWKHNVEAGKLLCSLWQLSNMKTWPHFVKLLWEMLVATSQLHRLLLSGANRRQCEYCISIVSWWPWWVVANNALLINIQLRRVTSPPAPATLVVHWRWQYSRDSMTSLLDPADLCPIVLHGMTGQWWHCDASWDLFDPVVVTLSGKANKWRRRYMEVMSRTWHF